MRASGLIHLLPLLAGIVFISSCAPTLREIGRDQGCETAEENLQTYIVREIKIERFEKNLPYRAALLPLSATAGLLLNYIAQTTFILPLLAPTGFQLLGDEFKGLLFEDALSYTPLRGSRLDDLDNGVIARANFEVGLCYYENKNYQKASKYFEMLLNSNYVHHIGMENLLFLLGDCYYMLSRYEESVESYRLFLVYCIPRDERIPLVKQRMKTIDALQKKGLWGMEREE